MKSLYELIFKEKLYNILKFLDLFVMFICPHLEELNLMQKQETVFWLVWRKEERLEVYGSKSLPFCYF